MNGLQYLSILVVLILFQSCDYPEYRELEVVRDEYKLEVMLARNCVEASLNSHGYDLRGKCVQLQAIITFMLELEYSQNFNRLTGKVLDADKAQVLMDIRSTGRATPYRFNISIKIPDQQDSLTFKKVLSKLEEHYNFKVSYKPKPVMLNVLKVTDRKVYESAVTRLKSHKDASFLVSGLTGKIETAYHISVIDSLNSHLLDKININLPTDRNKLDEVLRKSGISIREITVNIPFPFIEFL